MERSPSTSGDVSPVSTTDVNEVFTTSWRAGAKASLVFFYNLGSNDYIRDGELKIVVPRNWTGPSGVDLAQSDVDDDTLAEDKPSVAVSGKYCDCLYQENAGGVSSSQ